MWARKVINSYCLFSKSINVLEEEMSSVTHKKPELSDPNVIFTALHFSLKVDLDLQQRTRAIHVSASEIPLPHLY